MVRVVWAAGLINAVCPKVMGRVDGGAIWPNDELIIKEPIFLPKWMVKYGVYTFYP